MNRKPSALDRARFFFFGLIVFLLLVGLQAIGGAVTDQPTEAVTQTRR